ncbi:MAG TPA: helix-hairpin-helix domain-containing protein [Sandaracinaceae bacterium]
MTNTIQNLARFGWLRAGLAALGVAAALSTLAPADASAQRGRRAAAAQVEQSEGGVVNIQTATVEQLQLLPGIGPSKAQAIVAFRERRAFRRVEDLMRVRGIGRATFRRLRPMLTVDGPTTMTAPARAPRAAAASADVADVDEQE